MEKNIIENRYSYGKYLRKAKGLRQPDPNSVAIPPPQQLAEYISFLKDKGLQCDKVEFSQFITRNGLPYSGLRAKELIKSNEVFISLPVSALLTTKKAFFNDTELNKVFQAHPEFFSSAGSSSWEDHIIWAFLLKENEKGRASEWYHLLQNLPREIDYLIFWEDTEIDMLEDPKLKKKALHTRAEFEFEYRQLSRILIDYVPSVFKSAAAFSYEDAKWIYIHLVSRCFGKYFAYVTMVPFAELLNHECSDVYYDFKYNEDNPAKSEQAEFPEPKQLEQLELDDNDSSDGSYHSWDSDSDGDFDWEKNIDPQLVENQLENHSNQSKHSGTDCTHLSIQTTIKQALDPQKTNICLEDSEELEGEVPVNESLNVVIRREIQLLSKEIFLWAYNNLDYSDNISVFYAARLLGKTRSLERAYMTKKLSYFSVKEELKRLETMNSQFKTELLLFYKLVNGVADHYKIPGQKKKRRTLKSEQHENDLQDSNSPMDQNKTYFQPKEKWADDKFDTFVMKASSKDQFEQHSQVYFCYGRLSNRSLLMRYGMTLEYNKYDHVFLRLPYLQLLPQHMIPKIAPYSYNISLYKRFKLKRHAFNLDLLTFLRVQRFQTSDQVISIFFSTDLETERYVLSAAICVYEHVLKDHFDSSVEENEAKLSDKAVGYHEYFSLVYKLERQRIIQLQLILCKVAKTLIEKMIAKESDNYPEIANDFINEIESQSDREQANRHRYLLQDYFKRLKLDEAREHKKQMVVFAQKIQKNEESEKNRQRYAEEEELERAAKKKANDIEMEQRMAKQKALLEKIKKDAGNYQNTSTSTTTATGSSVTSYKYQPYGKIADEDPVKKAQEEKSQSIQQERLQKSLSIRVRPNNLSQTHSNMPQTITEKGESNSSSTTMNQTTNSTNFKQLNMPKHIGLDVQPQHPKSTKNIGVNLNPAMNLLRPLSIAELSLKHGRKASIEKNDQQTQKKEQQLENDKDESNVKVKSNYLNGNKPIIKQSLLPSNSLLKPSLIPGNPKTSKRSSLTVSNTSNQQQAHHGLHKLNSLQLNSNSSSNS